MPKVEKARETSEIENLFEFSIIHLGQSRVADAESTISGSSTDYFIMYKLKYSGIKIAAAFGRQTRSQWSRRQICQTTSRYQAASDALDNAYVLLGLSDPFTKRDLKNAYRQKCLLLHPDHSSLSKEEASHVFIMMSKAYELLQRCTATADNRLDPNKDDFDMTEEEEADYRESCKMWLAVDADIVEESKANEGFREWLKGRTDSADHWRCFFYAHGGLAPKKLRMPALIGSGDQKIRRKRR